MSKNAVKYIATSRKTNGETVEWYCYYIYASDSNYNGYRIISAIGPEGLVVKEHWLSKRDDEQAAVEERVKSWHDGAEVEVVKKESQ